MVNFRRGTCRLYSCTVVYAGRRGKAVTPYSDARFRFFPFLFSRLFLAASASSG